MLPFDEKTDFCWGSDYFDLNEDKNVTCLPDATGKTVPRCCCYQTVCNVGTFEAVFRVMRDSMYPPHVLDLDWSLTNFSGNLTAGYFPSSSLSAADVIKDLRL